MGLSGKSGRPFSSIKEDCELTRVIPYGRDGLVHSCSLSTARRALRVAQVGVASSINHLKKIKCSKLAVSLMSES